MYDNPRKRPSHRKRALLIVLAVLVMATCALVVYLLMVKSNILRGGYESLTRTPTREVTVAALNATTFLRADTARMLPPPKSSGDGSAWQTLLARVTALLKGDKPEVCGLSDLDSALFIAGDPEVGTSAVNTTLARLTGKLVESDNPAERVQGLYMQAHLADWAQRNADSARYRICGGDFECTIKLSNEQTAPTSNAQEQVQAVRAAAAAPLVKLALASRDPNTIAAAIHACRHIRIGACGTISIADWAAIEPDNAAVWLMMAETTTPNDTAARADALRRAAAATGYDMRVPSLASVFASDLVKAQTRLVQSEIGDYLASSTVSAAIPPVMGFATYCLRDKTADDARAAVCDTLVNTMAQKDESLVGASMAIAIGAKIGWDETRLQPLRDERVILYGRMNDSFSKENLFSCNQLEQRHLKASDYLSKSERMLARELAAKSGKTVAELANDYRRKYPSLAK